MKKVIVIGSGFSSLSAACYLAKAGYKVEVIEKNKDLGGRARQLQVDGFSFDIGPTWYWMPDVFEKFFADFDKIPSDYYTLTRLDPSYRIFFDKAQYIDLPVGLDEQAKLFESIEPGSGEQLKTLIREAAETYRIAVQGMVYKPGLSPLELISVDTLSNVQLFLQSMRTYVQKKFKHPHLVKLLEFPVLFLGAKPGNTPAFYNFMNYADLALGTWYPEGGMYSVVRAMVSLARSLGVTFTLEQSIEKIVVVNGKAVGVQVRGNVKEFDLVVSGADYHHTEQLLDSIYRVYSEAYWNKRTFAPSALLFFVGVNKKLKNVLHHTLFFDEEFDAHAEAIYSEPQWPDKPLFYCSVSSLTDADSAPAGMDNLTILVPIAPGIIDTEEIREHYFRKIISRLEKITCQTISDAVVVRKTYCINEFIEDYNAFKGNAYGLANTLTQTAFLRPSIKSKKVKDLYFTGQLTVPGPGVPPSIISGKVVATEILKNHQIPNYADPVLS